MLVKSNILDAFICSCTGILRLTIKSSAFYEECRYQNSPEFLLSPMLRLKYYVLVQMSGSLSSVIFSKAERFLGRS